MSVIAQTEINYVYEEGRFIDLFGCQDAEGSWQLLLVDQAKLRCHYRSNSTCSPAIAAPL